MKPRILVVFSYDHRTDSTFSYFLGWPLALKEYLGAKVTLWNLTDSKLKNTFFCNPLQNKNRWDTIFILHSTFSNQCNVPPRVKAWLSRQKSKKVFFIGNEYKSLPQKLDFARSIGVSLLFTQSHSSTVHKLYASALGCRVEFIPNTGFNPKTFYPSVTFEKRPIDIGYRTTQGPPYLGHTERVDLANKAISQCRQLGLKFDISTNEKDRFDTPAWAHFLNQCKAQLGVESGTDYFDLDDRVRLNVNRVLENTPDATRQDLHNQVYSLEVDPVALRNISGRNVEAAATKTLQIQIRGEYGNYLKPWVHYVPIEKDYSNLKEALSVVKDLTLVERIVANAYEIAQTELSYPALIQKALRSALV